MACEVCQKVYVPTEDILMDSDVKPHLCNTCGRSFSLKIQLKRHILTHADNAPYTCYSCEKNSDNQSKTYNLRLTKKGNYMCEKCNSSFNTRRLLLRHSKEHEVPEIFTCEECEIIFDSEQALKKHSSIHKAKRPYRRHSAKVDDAESSPVCDEQETFETFTCEECGALFASELDLKKHGSIHKAKRPYKRHSIKVEVAESSLVCGECGKSFTDAKIFQKHSLSHKKHPCTDCSKSFATIAGLQKHKNGKCKSATAAAERVEMAVKSEKGAEENEAEDKKHVCGICGKSFSRKSSLEGHVIVHLTEEENGSEIDDEFNDHDYVQGVQEKEKIDPEPPRLPKLKIRTKFRCNNCEEVFTTDEDLKKHDEQTHKSKGGIKVEEDHLIVKVKKEPEEKKYDCSFCSESFLSRKKLEGHYVDAHDAKNVKRKYTPSRRPAEKDTTFLCQICDKVFGRKSRLKKHLLFHENKLEEDVSSDGMESIRKRKSKAKNYPCETCGRRFAGRICLEKHMLKHSESKNEDAPSSSNGETPTPKRRKNVKELICEFCKEDFTGRKNAFIKHRNLHTPEVCGICDERFVDRQALREHCKSHIGTEEARVFLECSQKAFNAKNGIVPPEPKVEYIYLVLR